MRDIKLNKKDKEVCLETRKAQCKFCGEGGKEVVKGSVPFKSPKLELQWVNKRLFSQGELMWVVPSLLDQEISSDADICYDCIKQLAKLVK